jgi:hypothetical protein
MSTALAKKDDEIRSLRARFANIRKKENGVVRSLVDSALVSGSAFALAYYDARFPDKAEILGVPVALAVGGAALVTQLAGWAGSESDLIGSVGTGALAAYAAAKGATMGAAAAENAPASTST